MHYEREEILWMLDYIGHPDYKIRDELIFVSLARAIQEQLFTKDQFDFVVIEALKRQGLLYKRRGWSSDSDSIFYGFIIR